MQSPGAHNKSRMLGRLAAAIVFGQQINKSVQLVKDDIIFIVVYLLNIVEPIQVGLE
jgi:hypothetical protein